MTWIRTATGHNLINSDDIMSINIDQCIDGCSIRFENTHGYIRELAHYADLETCQRVMNGLFDVLTNNRVCGVTMPTEENIDDILNEWNKYSFK